MKNLLFFLIIFSYCYISSAEFPDFSNLKKITFVMGSTKNKDQFENQRFSLQELFTKFLLRNSYENVLASLTCTQNLVDLNPGLFRINLMVNQNDETYIDIIYFICRIFHVHPLKIALDLFKVGFSAAPKALLNFTTGPNCHSFHYFSDVHHEIEHLSEVISKKLLSFSSFEELQLLMVEINFIATYQLLKKELAAIF